MRINNKFEFKVAQSLLLASGFKWKISGGKFIKLDNYNFPTNIKLTTDSTLVFTIEDEWDMTIDKLLDKYTITVTDIPNGCKSLIKAIFNKLKITYNETEIAVYQEDDINKVKLKYDFNSFLDYFDDNIYIKESELYLANECIELLKAIGDDVQDDNEGRYKFDFDKYKWVRKDDFWARSLERWFINVRDLSKLDISENIAFIGDNTNFNKKYNNVNYDSIIYYNFENKELSYSNQFDSSCEIVSTLLYNGILNLELNFYFEYNDIIYKIIAEDNYVYKGKTADDDTIIVEKRAVEYVNPSSISESTKFLCIKGVLHDSNWNVLTKNIIKVGSKLTYVTDKIIQLTNTVFIKDNKNYILTVDNNYLCYETLELGFINDYTNIYEYSGRCKTLENKILFKESFSNKCYDMFYNPYYSSNKLIIADFNYEKVNYLSNPVEYDVSVFELKGGVYSRSILNDVKINLINLNGCVKNFDKIKKLDLFGLDMIFLLTFSDTYVEFDGRFVTVHLDCFGIKEEYKYIITKEFKLILC